MVKGAIQMEIRTVLVRKDGVKHVFIPKKSKIQGGEQVLITNNLNLINKIKKEENK